MSEASISALAAFEDNYIWLLRVPGAAAAAVVDPGDAEPVLAALAAERLDLGAILLTHHHRDHIGGVAELQARFPHAEVLAPRERRIPLATRRVGEGDRPRIARCALAPLVLEVPGHTATHVAYLIGDALLCGDTLFAAGCGRVFDGGFEQLAASLRRLAALPLRTRCYCAHEYTLANLGFARWVEPDRAALAAREDEARRQRRRGEPTLPTTIDLELATNPFLRTAEPAVIAAAEAFAGQPLRDATEVFAALRRWKDTRYD